MARCLSVTSVNERRGIVFSVFKRELRAMLCGYRAYTFIAVFSICYLAVRMIYNYILLYDNIYGFMNHEYILMLLPAAFAFAVPVLTFSMYSEERTNNVFSFLRSLPLSNRDVFFGKYLSRFALFGATYAVMLVVDVVLGAFGGAPIFTVMYSVLCYILIAAVMLSMNIFLATVIKNKYLALGVSYGISAILTVLTVTRYSMPRLLCEIIEPISIFGTYTTAVFGAVDIVYIFLWLSLSALFTYLSYVFIKKEIRL